MFLDIPNKFNEHFNKFNYIPHLRYGKSKAILIYLIFCHCPFVVFPPQNCHSYENFIIISYNTSNWRTNSGVCEFSFYVVLYLRYKVPAGSAASSHHLMEAVRFLPTLARLAVIQFCSWLWFWERQKIAFISNFTFMLPCCIVINFFLNNQSDALIIQIYSVMKLYMFQASSLPIIRSFLLYIRHW
jgi:hypothetical protein